MRLPASIRSGWARVQVAVRRVGDVFGVGPAVAAAAAVALVTVVAVLGALLAPWPLAVAALVLLVLVAAVTVLAARVLSPIRTLTGDVERATKTLPTALRTDAAADGPILAAGPAEVVALAGAVTSLQAAAVALATQEHDRHRRTSALATHLARRNHGLVDRLVTQIGELETAERSPIVLSQLSRLKHTATRTRRHAESMLVLSGALPDRGRPRPAAVRDVLQAALDGIEDHARIATDDVEPAAVSGSVVADLAHLLAELVENAAHFSPPGTRIRISGAPASEAHGYCIRVVDDGVGMTADQLRAANDRIRHATSGAQPAKLIGLDVVGRLATRHEMTVTLAHGPGGGVEATVALPGRLLRPLSDLPAPRRPVSALVAAAAFRPPLASGGEQPSVGAVDSGAAKPARRRVAVAAQDEVRPGVPRRVRGAQLPDLGPDREDGGPHVTPDAGRVHGRLHALQAGLSAARSDNIPPLPVPLPRTEAPAPDGDD